MLRPGGAAVLLAFEQCLVDACVLAAPLVWGAAEWPDGLRAAGCAHGLSRGVNVGGFACRLYLLRKRLGCPRATLPPRTVHVPSRRERRAPLQQQAPPPGCETAVGDPRVSALAPSPSGNQPANWRDNAPRDVGVPRTLAYRGRLSGIVPPHLIVELGVRRTLEFLRDGGLADAHWTKAAVVRVATWQCVLRRHKQKCQ